MVPEEKPQPTLGPQAPNPRSGHFPFLLVHMCSVQRLFGLIRTKGMYHQFRSDPREPRSMVLAQIVILECINICYFFYLPLSSFKNCWDKPDFGTIGFIQLGMNRICDTFDKKSSIIS
jgi:hypothetical protein